MKTSTDFVPVSSPQDAFDRVCARLRDGTGQALNAEGACSYGVFGGHRCAIGHLMPADYVAPADDSLENSFSWISSNDPFKGCDHLNVERDFSTLGTCLQKIHDGYFDGYGIFCGESALQDCAANFGLVYTLPKAV
jgi:hypothetical protein